MTRESKLSVVVCGATVLGALGLLLISCLNPQPPVVPPVPGPDSGFHMALDAHGNQYQIDTRYDAMNDVQRGDANRFSREYPDGNG